MSSEWSRIQRTRTKRSRGSSHIFQKIEADADGSEMNMAENARRLARAMEPTAWQGLQETIEVIATRGIKVVINGGALNPKGLAEKTFALIREQTELFLRTCSLNSRFRHSTSYCAREFSVVS